MGSWDAATEQRALRLVQAVCAPGRPPVERDRAWQALLALLAPHLEGWIARGTVLRRVGLDGEDDVRAVLVDAIARLHDRDCRNLRDFLASEPPDPDELDELGLIDELAQVTGAGEPPPRPTSAAPSASPLRAWLLTLCRFVAKDHVKRRFGWTSIARAQLTLAGGAPEPEPRAALVAALSRVPGAIEARWRDDDVVALYRPGAVTAATLAEVAIARGWALALASRPLRSKRDLYSGADRLDAVADVGARPPITDLVTAREVLTEVRAFMATLPADMRRALELWTADATFDEIGAALGVAATAARALVRAGQARLRERFRPIAPALFGAAP